LLSEDIVNAEVSLIGIVCSFFTVNPLFIESTHQKKDRMFGALPRFKNSKQRLWATAGGILIGGTIFKVGVER
jgi:hypothetical protein